MKQILGFLACIVLIGCLFGCSMNSASTASTDSLAESHSAVLQSQAGSDSAASSTAVSASGSSKSSSAASSLAAKATPAPSETPSTGNLPTAPLLAGLGLICLGSAGLIMLKRI